MKKTTWRRDYNNDAVQRIREGMLGSFSKVRQKRDGSVTSAEITRRAGAMIVIRKTWDNSEGLSIDEARRAEPTHVQTRELR